MSGVRLVLGLVAIAAVQAQSAVYLNVGQTDLASTSVSVHVVTDGCDALDVESFKIIGAENVFPACAPIIDEFPNTSFNCQIGFSMVGGDTVTIEQDLVLSYPGATPVDLTYSPVPYGEINSYPDTSVLQSPQFPMQFRYTGNVQLFPVAGYGRTSLPVTVFVNGIASNSKIDSILFEDTYWTIYVNAVEGESVQVSIDESMVMNLGQAVGAGTKESEVKRSGEPGACVMSPFTPYSACLNEATGEACRKPSTIAELNTPSKTRTRTVEEVSSMGLSCPPTTETVECNAFLCPTASYPFSGESPEMCAGGLVNGGCNPTNPNVAKDGFEMEADCSCSQDCTQSGTCCQGFYTNGCCESPPCLSFGASIFFDFAPPTCEVGDCFSSLPKTIGDHFQCYCDDQCEAAQNCCGGSANRNDQCGAAPTSDIYTYDYGLFFGTFGQGR